ncbi:hypothetical protein [Streptomyces aidingensis]|uniref:Uncharacterized protein n=1 Tax=Streptomyces aidingensis TaxID=910347 RepID=A0A1I1NM82_9ACTN|nr:hypothetical protein [Streptomyces aidingensis]SFC98759.1 hypothetical protein SAMN05421773_10875 [Streptomyces aidingensis]
MYPDPYAIRSRIDDLHREAAHQRLAGEARRLRRAARRRERGRDIPAQDGPEGRGRPGGDGRRRRRGPGRFRLTA